MKIRSNEIQFHFSFSSSRAISSSFLSSFTVFSVDTLSISLTEAKRGFSFSITQEFGDRLTSQSVKA